MSADPQYEWDVAVIGGGSGGIAFAKQAAKLGAKVALFDAVKPSPQGSTWGLGGTCVNVGCIPKKLFHHAGLMGAALHDASHFGWDVKKPEQFQWEKLVENVQNHIGSLNWGYRTELIKNKVKYIKALAEFQDEHTIKYLFKKKERTTTAKYVVLAMGGRPVYPDVPGAKEFCLTSDDIFSRSTAPGKTLCVGGAYISLETAGFLTEMGYDVTVAVRSILLRGFDRDCSERIGKFMEKTGTKFRNLQVPSKVEKQDSGKLLVTFTAKSGEESQEEFDTVLFATGRKADTTSLGLDKAGVVVNKSGKIDTINEQTNVSHIFAVGDILEGRPELTPVAIHAGKLLAKRLFGGSKELMDYDMVPTTVFSAPFEYGMVGLSEDDAIARFGEDNVETYLSSFNPVELAAAHRTDVHGGDLGNSSLCKLVCHKANNERVIGLHIISQHAGEITQGFALAMKLGATKHDFDTVVGIHPTAAESFTTLTITRASGEDPEATGC